MKKKIVAIFFIIIILFFSLLIYLKIFKKNEELKVDSVTSTILEDSSSNSNIMKDVNYVSKDSKGNEYIINALEGEIDYSDSNTIYLTDVSALIKLTNSNNIKITSKYGKYNTINFDTIFSKNVIINYLDNKITGEYLDFSINRNTMIITRNVIYTNLENILKADVAEINIKTKDTKIFMYENKKKVNIKSKNWYGNYKKV